MYAYVLDHILPTHTCMYVERERTQSYLLDIWYVCRERTYTIICFYVHAYTGIFRDRLD